MIDALLEKNILPDWLVRIGIRRLLAQRLRDEETGGDPRLRMEAYVHDLKHRPVAEDTRAANEEHYEVPTRFFTMCLGRRLKYSGCYFPRGDETLDQAEEAMLGLYVERARIADGQHILELGCGWGSFSLYLAERFPGSRITGVSNSRTQKEFIDSEARRRGIGNLTIDALSRGDLPILKAVTILGALALVAFNLINDLLYALADPRVRLS